MFRDVRRRRFLRAGMVSIAALLAGAPALAADIGASTTGVAVPSAGDTVQSGVTVSNSGATGTAAVAITSGTSGSPQYFYNFGTVQSVAGSSQSAIGPNNNDYINITNNSGGTIESLGSGDAIRLDDNITISNSGTIHSVGGAEAIRIDQNSSVTNFGSITGDLSPTSANNSNTLRVGSGTVINGSALNTTALIENTGSATTYSGADQGSNVYALSVGESSGTTTVTNYGIIRTTGDVGSAETGHDEGEVGAVRLRGDANTLYNYGTIETTGHILASPDTNSDPTDDTQEIGDMYGIRMDGDGDIVHNYGTGVITGGKHGVTVDKDASNATVINELGGTITGENGSGIGSDATTGTVTVTNYGTITGTWNQAAFNGGNLAYSFGDGDGVDIDHLADVENYGTIQGTGAHGTKPGETSPSKSEGLAIGGGTVVNGDATHTTALISGADYGVTVNDSSDGDAYGATDLTNYGTIRGLNGYAIKFTDVAGTLSNTITNYGTISGTSATSVLMGNGGDIFNNFGGSVTGIVDAEGGDDTLNIDRGDSFTLTGTNWTNFETTNVQSGTVTLSGDYTSATAFNVDAGATFSAASKVTTTTFTNAGTVKAGTASTTGTLTVAGDFVNAAGGIYQAKLDTDGNADLIHATGTATISGGTLQVASLASFVKWSDVYTLLDGNSLSGTFTTFDASALAPSAYWTPTLSYGADALTLSFVSTGHGYADFATGLTAGGAAVADALFAAHDNATDPLKSILGALDSLDTSNPTDQATLGAAFNQLAPDPSDGTTMGSIQATFALQQQTNERIASLQSSVASARGGARLALAGGEAGDLTASLVGGSVTNAAEAGFWLRGFGLTGSLDAQTGQANGLDYTGGGFEAGYDRFIGDTTLVGLSAGYARILNDPDRADASSDVTSYSAGLYAATLLGAVDLSGQLGYARNDYHASRRILIVPLVDDVAAADFDGSTVSASAEAGYTLTFGDIALRPAAGLDWMRVESDGYTETGAAGFNLTQASQSDNLVRSTVGASASLSGGPVVPSLGLRWGHDIKQADGALSYAFAGLANSAFLVERNTPDRDALLVDAGLDTELAQSLSLSLAGSADLRNNAQGYGLSLKLRYDW